MTDTTTTMTAPPAEPPAWVQMEQQAEGAARSKLSLLVGILVSYLLVAPLVDFLLVNWWFFWLLGLNDAFTVHLVFNLMVGSLYFVWGLEDIPVGSRGALLVLGQRLLRSGSGLSEGYQWVPKPFMSIRPVDCKPKSVDIGDEEGAYSKDGPLMATNGFQRYRVFDPYRFLGVDDVVPSLERLARQSVRIEMKGKKALEARNADKKDFSDEVATTLHAQLDANGNPNGVRWGIRTGVTVIDDIWAVDPKLEAAWTAKVREQAEGEAEEVQTTRRLEQVQKYIEKKVDPDLAVVAAQTDVEKPGARVNTVSIPGLSKAFEAMAKALENGLKNLGTGRGKR